jgi:hypothetical protein
LSSNEALEITLEVGEVVVKSRLPNRTASWRQLFLNASIKPEINLELVEEQTQTIAKLKCMLEATVLDAYVEQEITHEVVEEQGQTTAELKCQLEQTIFNSFQFCEIDEDLLVMEIVSSIQCSLYVVKRPA